MLECTCAAACHPHSHLRQAPARARTSTTARRFGARGELCTSRTAPARREHHITCDTPPQTQPLCAEQTGVPTHTLAQLSDDRAGLREKLHTPQERVCKARDKFQAAGCAREGEASRRRPESQHTYNSRTCARARSRTRTNALAQTHTHTHTDDPSEPALKGQHRRYHNHTLHTSAIAVC